MKINKTTEGLTKFDFQKSVSVLKKSIIILTTMVAYANIYNKTILRAVQYIVCSDY